MKVLLVVPTYHYNHHYPSFMPSVLFPSGFAYIASALKEARHEVYGLNLNNITGYNSANNMLFWKLNHALATIEPDIVGLGGLCTDYLFIKDSIDIIRSIEGIPKAKIILGGNIVTNDAEYIFNLLKPDYCTVGEAEEAIVNICNNINSIDSSISNIGYWRNGKAVFTEKNLNYRDINLLPFPDYDIFNIEDMMEYTLTARWAYRFINSYPKPWIIHTARSCPFTCTFCIHGHNRPRYRTRSIRNIMEEIEHTYNKYKYNVLIIMDELFAANKKRMVEFCTALSWCKNTYGWDFDWSFFAHPNANLDRETLQLAKDAGCFYFSYGIESASPRVLESMKKKTKPAQIAQAIKLAHDVKLGFGGNFIFGDPAETEDTVEESLNFALHNCKDIDMYINAIRPYPGSKIFNDCIDRGIITDKFNYYEHIDERPWDFSYNMTSMSDKTWLPLLDSIIAFGQLLPWMKSVVPHRYEVDSESANSSAVLHTGKQVYIVSARCPHCDGDIHCRELLMLEKPKAADKITTKDTKLIKDAVIKAIRLINLYYFSFKHPIYKLLKASTNDSNLLWKSFLSTVFFDTGCPHCGKSVKVVIPTPLDIKTFSIGEIKRKLRLSEV